MFCHKCGNKMPEDASFCQKCGAKLLGEDTAPQTTVEPVSKASPEPAESTDVEPAPTKHTEQTPAVLTTPESIPSKEKVSDLEFLGSRFEVTEKFIKLNSVRSVQEREYYELIRHHREIKKRMQDELESIANSKVHVQKMAEAIKSEAGSPKKILIPFARSKSTGFSR